ncbi:diphthamide synthesis protein [Candidatus Woesearchaeota archaeon]|nr:diphthamide synthesis protein [Candidatus Woesearchaeota archaeon]
MKIMHIKAEIEENVLPAVRRHVNRLPAKIGLLTIVQHISQVDKVKNFLERKGKKVFIGEGKKTGYKGQVLGCDFEVARNVKEEVDGFLYIGTGGFHPLGIVLYTGKDVFAVNPLTKEMKEYNRKDTEGIERRRKGALLKFYSSKTIGIIVSTKPGQNRMKEAMQLKEELKNKGKECYVFLTDTLDFSELENFPFIECYVNTMCPRIGLDDAIRTEKPIINIEDIK